MGLKNVITQDDILTQIGCEKILKSYYGDFNLRSSYNSVLRTDAKKSTGFYVNKKGLIIYNDFTTGEKYDCIQLVRKLLSIKYKKDVTVDEAILDIANTFNLKEGSGILVSPDPVFKQKEKNVFRVTVRPFTKKDKEWWGTYGITEQELSDNDVYSVKELRVGKFTFKTGIEELRYAYLLKDNEGNGYFKIYTPFSKKGKWYFNATLNLVFGLDKLNYESDTLIITKSVKDYIVLKKFKTDVIALQNESLSSITDDTMDYLKKKYKHIIVFFDMDRAGIKASNEFKRKHNTHRFFLGDKDLNVWTNLQLIKELNVKDPSDYVQRFGLNALEIFLKKFKLIK